MRESRLSGSVRAKPNGLATRPRSGWRHQLSLMKRVSTQNTIDIDLSRVRLVARLRAAFVGDRRSGPTVRASSIVTQGKKAMALGMGRFGAYESRFLGYRSSPRQFFRTQR